MKTKLILIRHGQTHWNAQKKYCGFMDVGLSPKGKRQAEKLHRRLHCEKVHHVYASDRKRAVQTAQIVFKEFKIKKLKGLREMHFGCFEGLTHKQIMKKHRRVYQKWLNDPFNCKIPEGETLKSFKKRVAVALRKIVDDNPGKTVAVVFHGGAISIFITTLLKNKDFWKWIPSSTSMSVIEYENKKPKVVLLNDDSHIKKARKNG
ncbi:histidine phosphatase family protein [bacterium]|nr:MAG: histidine phosphatase family protein [bacterium]